MELKQRYEAAKAKLLADESICPANRRLFAEFFKYEEYKLKRVNGLAELDDASFKTVLQYVSRFRTVNRWFQNKPWVDLTKDDIKAVYDAVEDGRIVTWRGARFADSGTYYRKILRSKPFELAGKKSLVAEVMEFQLPRPRSEVRFIRLATFRQLVDVVGKQEHRLLLWLAWDIGENVTSLLRLRKRDFTRATNAYSQEPEYQVNLRVEILKRSRTARTEITNYRETVDLLDRILAGLAEGGLLFNFGHRMASKMLERAARLTEAHCIPSGQAVTLKDLRSSMACDLLSKGWTTDEVNQRLGHRPSSREIDKYVNWLALGRHRPKRRLHDNQIESLTGELREMKDRERLHQQRVRDLQSRIDQLSTQLEQNNRLVHQQVVRLVRDARERGLLAV